MSEQQTCPADPHAELAAQLADPPADLAARVTLLDDAAGRLQAALTALDEV